MKAWVTALLLASAPSFAQAPEWRAAAPLLALDGPVQPLRGTVAVGGSAWGPWRRVCREQGAGPVQRSCLSVVEARAEGPAMRLTLMVEGPGVRISALRSVEGRILAFQAVGADGAPLPAEPARDRLLADWREQFAAASLERQSIPRDGTLELPVRGSQRGMRCRTEGQGRRDGREVVLLACEVALAGRLGSSATPMTVEIFARMAVDRASGMIVAQSYATRIERFDAGRDGRPRSAGVVVTPSRVVLE